MCMDIFSCIYVICSVCMQCPQSPEEDIAPSGTGITEGCKLPIHLTIEVPAYF